MSGGPPVIRANPCTHEAVAPMLDTRLDPRLDPKLDVETFPP